MIIPTKATPKESGKVFLIGAEVEEELVPALYDTVDSAIGIAKNLTCTDLPIKEGGYGEQPSVLIIMSRDETSPDQLAQVNLNKQVYGTNEQVSDGYYQFPFVEEKWFLNSIRLSDHHGINFFTKLHDNGDYKRKTKGSGEYVSRIMELAKKHFDLTFIVSEISSEFRYLQNFSMINKKVLITSRRATMKRSKKEKLSHITVSRVEADKDPRVMAGFMRSSSGLFLLDPSSVKNKSLIPKLEQRVARKLIVPDEKPFNYPSLKGLDKKRILPVEHVNMRIPLMFSIPFVLTYAIMGAASVFLEGAVETSSMDMLSAGIASGSPFAISGIYLITGNKIMKSPKRQEAINSYLKRVELSTEEEGQPKYYPLRKPAVRNVTSSRQVKKRNATRDGNLGEETKRVALKALNGKHTDIEALNAKSNNGNEVVSPAHLDRTETLGRIEELQNRWVEYELDPLKLLELPLMSDVSCEETLEFHQAYNSLLSAQRSYEKENTSLGKLYDTLLRAEKAFIKAEYNAKKSKHSTLTKEERRRVGVARKLISIALSEESSPNERIIAWEKANDQLEGIIHLPDTAVKGLLEAGTGVKTG